eukprot:3936439-Rhodomonas_salina.1
MQCPKLTSAMRLSGGCACCGQGSSPLSCYAVAMRFPVLTSAMRLPGLLARSGAGQSCAILRWGRSAAFA